MIPNNSQSARRKLCEWPSGATVRPDFSPWDQRHISYKFCVTYQHHLPVRRMLLEQQGYVDVESNSHSSAIFAVCQRSGQHLPPSPSYGLSLPLLLSFYEATLGRKMHTPTPTSLMDLSPVLAERLSMHLISLIQTQLLTFTPYNQWPP